MRFFLFLFCFFSLFFSITPIQAETLRIVTGEYAPFSGEALPSGGVSTKLVKAAFLEIKKEITIEFIPWNRAMNYLKMGSVAGSYPWTKNAEREKDILYSRPIHQYRLLSYLKKSDVEKKINLTGKRGCLPSGWDLNFVKKSVDKYKLTMVHPINLESCFQMLAIGRVDVIITNEQVGNLELDRLYPKNSPIVGIDTGDLGGSNPLYFVVPKKYPDGQKIIADFNRGFQLIKKNGKYAMLIQELMNKENPKSTCDVCNRLGLL